MTKKLTDDEVNRLTEQAKVTGNDKRLSFHAFQCNACKEQPQFDGYPAFGEHLRTVHKIDTTKAKVTQRMGMHLDATKWYQTNYDCQIVDSDVAYTEFVREQRTGEDAMYWMEVDM